MLNDVFAFSLATPMASHKSNKVLIAPLDWGIGHAARCVPIIKEQLALGNEVILASNGRSAAFLKHYFPSLILRTDIPDYRITYPSSGSMVWHFAKDAKRILNVIKAEGKWLDKFIDEEKITHVISDNRYGLSSERISSTFITHQLNIHGAGGVQPLLRFWLKKYISRFDECLVPDYQGEENLSGSLSHGSSYLKNVRYTGPQSRFSSSPLLWRGVRGEVQFDYLAIISGPEPQRSLLQLRLLQTLKELKKPAAMLCGLPEGMNEKKDENVLLISHADDERFVQLINESKHIICRSGYSTLMDLQALNRKALLIPTPGQTEQEYLAQRFKERFGFGVLKQKEITAQNILKEVR